MKKTFTFFIISFLLFSCNKKVNSEKSNSTEKIRQNVVVREAIPEKLDLQLDVFKSLPFKISDCGDCYKFKDESDKSKNYIFLSSISNQAIIKVNDANIFLTKDTINSKIKTKDDWIEVYSGNGYEVTLEVEANGNKFIGTLKVKRNKKEIKFNVKGESGC